MSKLIEYIKTLSPEEQEQFADLITECRERDERIRANEADATDALEALRQTNLRVLEATSRLQKSVEQLRDNTYETMLKVVPPKGPVH